MKINAAHPTPPGLAKKPAEPPAQRPATEFEPASAGDATADATGARQAPIDGLPETARGAPAHVARELLIAQAVADGEPHPSDFGRLVSQVARGELPEQPLAEPDGATPQAGEETPEDGLEPPADTV